MGARHRQFPNAGVGRLHALAGIRMAFYPDAVLCHGQKSAQLVDPGTRAPVQRGTSRSKECVRGEGDHQAPFFLDHFHVQRADLVQEHLHKILGDVPPGRHRDALQKSGAKHAQYTGSLAKGLLQLFRRQRVLGGEDEHKEGHQ